MDIHTDAPCSRVWIVRHVLVLRDTLETVPLPGCHCADRRQVVGALPLPARTSAAGR